MICVIADLVDIFVKECMTSVLSRSTFAPDRNRVIVYRLLGGCLLFLFRFFKSRDYSYGILIIEFCDFKIMFII